MENYKFDELTMMTGSQLDTIESHKFGELEKVHKDKLKQIGKILWLQSEIEKAAL